MNIALFASAFYPHVGGVEELCRQLAHEYQARDHGVAVFTERWPRSLAAYEVYEGIPVHRIPFRVMSEGVRAKIKYLATHRAIRRRLLELLGRFRPDVVHVHCVSTNAYYALEVQEATGVPLIVSLHGELTMDAQGLFKRSALARDILRRGLRRADAVTACSRQTLAEAEAFFGEPLGEKGVVVYNGIAEGGGGEIVPFEHPRPYILAIGRHVRQKGFDILLHAMKQLGPAGDPYDLILAGDGVEHEPLKSLATALGLGDRVVFPGQVDHPAAISLFAVAARVGGVPEIVLDDENGLLVAPENPSELAETLRRLLADEAWQRRLGKAGRERAKLFTWPRIVEEYMAVYAAALSRSRGRQLALSRSL
jgi:glycogen(starch) synthase